MPRSANLAAIAIALVVVVGLTSLPAAAQSAAPKYDVATEMKMKGTLEELRVPPKGHEKEIVHMVMKNGDQTIDVYLCPKHFMDELGVAFNKGDEIAFTGSKISENGADMILARELVKGDDTLVFRDDKGKPVW